MKLFEINNKSNTFQNQFNKSCKHKWAMPKVKSVERFNGSAQKVVQETCLLCKQSRDRIERYADIRVHY